HPKQVDQHQHVEQSDADLHPGEVPGELKDLPGQEGCGKPDCQPLRPGFLKRQSNPFNEIETGLQKYALADQPHLVRRQQLDLIQKNVDEVALRVEPQSHGSAQQDIANVAVQQADHTQPKQDKEQAFQDLE